MQSLLYTFRNEIVFPRSRDIKIATIKYFEKQKQNPAQKLRKTVISGWALFDGNNLTPSVETAMRACAVRQLRFTALRTYGGGNGLKGVMSPSLIPSCSRMSIGWICHNITTFPYSP